MIKKKTIVLFLLIQIAGATAQDSWVAGIYSNYSMPVAGLANWFRPAVNGAVSLGVQEDGRTYEGVLEYTRFDRENISGYPDGKLDLMLEHAAVLYSVRYRLGEFAGIKPEFHFAVGPHYWKGIRGEIAANDELGIPYIRQRVLEEWNWGARTGFAAHYRITADLAVELMGYYRLIIGDLWPTLQEHIELENVSGFQTINISAGFRYTF